jgi:hypothetical protein
VDTNIYALEVITKSRLADLRAAAARQALFESVRNPRRSAWAVLKSALPWTGSRGQVLQSRISGLDPARLARRDAGLQDLTPLTRR